MDLALRAGFGLLAALAAGCTGSVTMTTAPPPAGGPTAGPTETPRSPSGGLWTTCYESFSTSGSARGDLARLTRSCGPTGGMRAVTPITVAKQSDKDPVDRYTFYVPKAGACYRVYAVGDGGIKDLDLLVRGPGGEDVVADLTHDAFPVLPSASPLCLEAAGLYLLEVSVYAGGGEYAIQVWGNPDGLGKATAQR